MNRIILSTALGIALAQAANAAIFTTNFTSGFQNGGVIPDGTLDGLTDTRTLSGQLGPIEDIKVTLNFSGGYNGDLYLYLVHNSQMVVLINRVGVSSSDAFGYADGGMNVTFAITAANGNIHNYGGGFVPTGIYTVDGRAIDPLSAPGAFDAAGTTSLANFVGTDGNGAWTLFAADVVGSGNYSTLSSWGIEITAVPEPTTIALGCFAGIFGLAGLLRLESVRNFLRRNR